MASHCPVNRINSLLLKTVVLLVLFAGIPEFADAQHHVEGVVLDAENNEPLPGANVIEEATGTGTTTGIDGRFDLTVADENATLIITFIGYLSETVELEGRSELTVHLQEDVRALEEVMVTAYGIEQERRRLGYSIERVDGSELTEAQEINLGDAIQGRFSGVNVKSPPTGAAGSSRIVIRGNAALEGDNQPLFIIDGVPLDNRRLGQAGLWGGFDGGDALSKINPNDIEDITVLKGASAAALYGSRAQDGAVVITTKSGARVDGYAATYNANITAENLLVDFDAFQYEYGQGTRGQAPQTQEEALETGLSSWGERIEGQQVVQFDGVERPYEAHPNNMHEFFQTGYTMNHSVAFTRTAEDYNLRLSMSRLDNDDIIPTTQIARTTANVRGNATLGDVYVDGRINYTIEETQFRPQLSDNPGNPVLSLTYMPTTVDVRDLRNYRDDDGDHVGFSTSIFRPNPYWAFNENMNEDNQRRVTGFLLGRYHVTDWLSLQLRGGTDYYTTRRTDITADGTPWFPQGNIEESDYQVREDNVDMLMQLSDRPLTDAIGVNATLGGNIRYEQFEQLWNRGENFIVPGLRTIGNTERGSRAISYSFNEKQVNSLFGSIQFDYDDFLYLELTGRNDWSSTLPPDNNSYFYPSVSTSFVFTDAINVPDQLSNGTVRASWARVGGDTDPYRLHLNYGIQGAHQARDGSEVPYGSIDTGEIPLADLLPSQTESVEIGTNLQFFNDRFGMDLTWYSQSTTNQILGINVPISTGYGSRVINAGNVRNQGIELLLQGSLVQTSDFGWRSRVNFTRNQNEVVELAEGVDHVTLGQSRSFITFVRAQPGEPFGQIVGTTYERDDEGRIVYGSDGLPQVGGLDVLGNQEPDWTVGWSNTLRYGNFLLNGLIDIQYGGDIYSLTNAQAYQVGRHIDTIEGREEGVVVGEGVQADGSENTVGVEPQDYYSWIGANIAEQFVYDASYVRLRELRLGYTFSPSVLDRIAGPVQGATISLVGRNLWLIHKNTPNIDPEAGYNVGNAHGLEHASLPSRRSIGMNFSLQF